MAKLKSTLRYPWCNGNTAPKAFGVIFGSNPWRSSIFADCGLMQNGQAKVDIAVPRGVTVTQRPLEALFMVRIHAG